MDATIALCYLNCSCTDVHVSTYSPYCDSCCPATGYEPRLSGRWTVSTSTVSSAHLAVARNQVLTISRLLRQGGNIPLDLFFFQKAICKPAREPHGNAY
ncbi:hypothetical protein M8J77_024948 [Diaphorina citri]|nr:hypothetical protein M8J77_024948 [Diaphorina citri]